MTIANEPDCSVYLATLDGELTDGSGRKGILEIKTTEIRRFLDWKKWNGTDTRLLLCTDCSSTATRV